MMTFSFEVEVGTHHPTAEWNRSRFEVAESATIVVTQEEALRYRGFALGIADKALKVAFRKARTIARKNGLPGWYRLCKEKGWEDSAKEAYWGEWGFYHDHWSCADGYGTSRDEIRVKCEDGACLPTPIEG